MKKIKTNNRETERAEKEHDVTRYSFTFTWDT